MKTKELDIPRWTARDEAKKWGAGHTKQDQLIAKAFRAIGRGQKVIDLYESFQIAGVDAQCRPMLAIARADASRLTGWYGQHSNGRISFRSDTGRSGHDTVGVPASFLNGVKFFDARARVPTVPPPLRQANLGRLWILFEAEWQAVTKDPFLLEHLGGALYRVVATWDLTPIEQVVLRGRSL